MESNYAVWEAEDFVNSAERLQHRTYTNDMDNLNFTELISTKI